MHHNLNHLLLQLLAKKNLFGYSKTIINQIHLIYWFLGEFYTSEKFNPMVTLFWRIQSIAYFATVIIHNTSYLLLSSDHRVTETAFSVASLVGVSYAMATFVLGYYLYNEHVIKAFRILDRANRGIPNTMQDKSHLRVVYTLLTTQIGLSCLHIAILYQYVVTGYDKDHLCNLDYFIYPLYCEGLRSWSAFVVLQLSQIVICVPVISLFLLAPLFPLLVAKEFHREYLNLCDFLNRGSKLFVDEYERIMISSTMCADQQIRDLQLSFVNSIHSCAKLNQDLLRGISHLRLYLEFNMSVSLVGLIVVQILLIYILILVKEESFMLTARFLCIVFVFAIMQYAYCLTAKLFEEMVQLFSDAIYDIPWYYMSASVRKSVHLSLHQSQVNVDFKALRTYPLNMGFFLRMYKNIYSAVNVLRTQVTYRD